MRPALPLMFGVLAGCAIFKNPNKPTDTSDPETDGGGSDGGTPSDGGSTSDGGTDDGGFPTDTGGDGGATDPLCDQTVNTGVPADACVTTDLTCDTRKIDTLKRGNSEFGSAEYEAWYCGWESGDPWDGRERVYAFNHPGTGSVTFTLDTPCAEMDLIVLRWGYYATDGTCPSKSTSLISECEMDQSSGDGEVSIYASTPSDYLVIIDGPDGSEENFALDIDCP